MFVIIGIVIVFGSVIGGYMLHGDIMVLFQPGEFLIIGGAAIGSFLIANPLPVIKQSIAGILGTLKGAKVSKKEYIELLQMLYEIFQYAKREGIIALEPHVEEPSSSNIFSKYPSFLANHHAVEFLTDTLKTLLSGGVPAHDLEELMDLDIEALHQEESVPPAAIQVVSDAFPGLGIVAAVLGIIVTMGAINQGAAVVGEKVAAALVGTFLGILMSYGLVGPLASNMAYNVSKESRYILAIKATVLSFAKGSPASIAIEYGRRAIDPSNRPSFKETEEAVKKA